MNLDTTLAYVIKAGLHAHKGALRDNDKSRAQIIPCPAAHRPILGALSPSEAHLHKPRGAQTQGQVGTQITDLEEGTPCMGTSLGCPRRASALWSRCDIHQDKSMLEHVWN